MKKSTAALATLVTCFLLLLLSACSAPVELEPEPEPETNLSGRWIGSTVVKDRSWIEADLVILDDVGMITGRGSWDVWKQGVWSSLDGQVKDRKTHRSVADIDGFRINDDLALAIVLEWGRGSLVGSASPDTIRAVLDGVTQLTLTRFASDTPRQAGLTPSRSLQPPLAPSAP